MPKKTKTPCREQSIEKNCKDVCHQKYQEEKKSAMGRGVRA